MVVTLKKHGNSHALIINRPLGAMAAAYLYHLTQGRGFVGGNQRTGIGAALVFLRINGHALRASEDELYDLSIAVADHRISKEHVVAFFEDRVEAR